MLKVLIPLLFLGCANKVVKVESFEPSGSMCLDSFYMNVKNSECVEINESIIDDKTISVTCTKSYTDTFWTNRTFYISTGEKTIDAVGIIPICIDHSVFIMTSVENP